MFEREMLSRRGFTMIEIMVAVALFLAIMVACVNVFRGVRVFWATGQGMVDINMTGRACADCIAMELTQAIQNGSTNIVIDNNSITAWVLGPSDPGNPRALRSITYSFDGGGLFRNGVQLAPDMASASPRPGLAAVIFALYGATNGVDVTLKVGAQGGTAPVVFQTRAAFSNKNRYLLQ